MKYIFLGFMLLLTSIDGLYAQTTVGGANVVDYTKLLLPPLETLFENARKSPNVEMYEARMEAHDNMLTSEKRSWLKYFKVGGSWQYGNVGVNSAFTNENTPLFLQSTSTTQSFLYGTAAIAVPFDDFFDRKNRVKRQKMERRFTELEMEKWFDEQRLRIVDAYVKVKTSISLMEKKIEDYNIANTSYKMAENEFKLGNANVRDLNSAKKLETEAFDALKTNEYQILNEVLSLEILSRTKIISK